MALRTVGVRLVAEVSDYTRKIKGAGQTTKEFAGEMATAAKGRHLEAVADQAGIAGVALAGAAAAAVKLSMDFERSMSAVSAATHASARDIGQLREAAIAAGKDTQYSATQAADAITELSKAGVGTADVLNGGLDGALDLAAAGQLDVAEAAETAASAMVQFKLKGKDIPHVADLLAAGAGKAQGSVHDMGAALNQSGLVAAQFGLSVEDTTGVLAEFANAGLTGSDAGTSFKTMLLALANPSGVTAKKMQELGISFYDAQGRFRGLGGVADELRDKLGHLTEEQRNAALGQIFGNDAIRAATILYRDGSAGVQQWRDKVNDAGYASDTAAKLTDNLAGDLERLRGSLETMAIEAGGGANSGLRVLAKSAGALVDEIGSLPTAVTGAGTVLAGIGGTLLLLGAGWIKARRATADMVAELQATGPAGEKAARGLQSTAKWAGRATVAFAAFEAASAAVSAAQKDLSPQVEAIATGFEKWAGGGKLTGESARVLGDQLEKLDGTFRLVADSAGKATWARNLQGGLESLIPGLDGTDTSLARTKERIEAMDAALAQLVSGGKAAEAKQAFDRLAQALATNGVSMEEFRAQFPQYAASVEVAGKATSTTAGDVTELGSAAGSSSGEVLALSESLDKLFQVQMSADRAALKLAQSTSDLTEELGKGKRTLSLNTEEGRKNRAAVLDQLDAIEATRDARVRGGQAMDDANAKYLKDIEGLKKIMRQADFTTEQINDMVGAYEDIPGQVATKISAPGVDSSTKKVRDYNFQFNRIPDKATTAISVTGDRGAMDKLDKLMVRQQALKKGITISEASAAYRKNAYGYAGGGWTGPGSKHQPAGVVHADEFVIQKESRQKIEAKSPGLLDEMNATGQVPGYDRGGRVAWPYLTTAAMTRIPSAAEAMGVVGGDFGHWPSSPGAQRGDSGVWRKIVALVRASGIPYDFGNGFRPGDPLWHGSGRAVDFMGYNQDRLAQFFMARQGQVLELIHRTKNRDYGLTRGHYNAMPHQWPLHRNHLHVAMAQGGTITEPIYGVGASGRTYSFGENWQHERVVPTYQSSGGGLGGTINLTVVNHGVIGSQMEAENFLVGAFDNLKRQGRI
jgi:TP901 family phage tail tape measure protein